MLLDFSLSVLCCSISHYHFCSYISQWYFLSHYLSIFKYSILIYLLIFQLYVSEGVFFSSYFSNCNIYTPVSLFAVNHLVPFNLFHRSLLYSYHIGYTNIHLHSCEYIASTFFIVVIYFTSTLLLSQTLYLHTLNIFS